MKKTVIAAGVVMVTWMVPAPAAAQTPSKGEQVYVAQRCSLCHSLDGKGQKAGPLDEVGSKLSADEIREWILHPVEMTKKTNATRKPPMRAYPNLAKEDVEALVTFLAAKKKKA
jgi:mono/diheme cytochrome c family protein